MANFVDIVALVVACYAACAVGYTPTETYLMISKCTKSYNSTESGPASHCPDAYKGAEVLVPSSWVLQGNEVSSLWKNDAFGLRDHVSIYFDLWWKGCNPEYGKWAMESCIGANIAAVAKAGYKIAIGPGMHEAPDYCFTKYDAQWRNARGHALKSGDFGMGCNLVFYPEAQAMVKTYFTKIKDRLKDINATLSLLRIGFAQTGEFNFPISNVGDGYWAFGRNGTALPGYPLGSYRPGNVTDYKTAQAFTAWYLESLAAAQNKMVSYVVELFPNANAAMLYPNRESLYDGVVKQTNKLAAGDASESGISFGWVRSLLIPRLADVKGAGHVLAWSTSAIAGEEKFHTLDIMQQFTSFAAARASSGSPSIRLAAENEGGQIQELGRLRDYLGYARTNQPDLIFLCCMTLPYSGSPDDLYFLVTATRDALMQRSVLCYPGNMHGTDDRLYSSDMSHMMRLQGDGNLVSYATNLTKYGASRAEFWQGQVVWSSQTGGEDGVHLAIQSDSGAHVVLYNGKREAIAHSNSVPCSRSIQNSSCAHAPHLQLTAGGVLKLTTDLTSETVSLQKDLLAFV